MSGFDVNRLKSALVSGSVIRMRDNLSGTARGRKQIVSVIVDAALAVLSLWGAYSLRSSEYMANIPAAFHVFAVVAPATVLLFAGLGVYRWVVRSSNTRLFRQLLKGSVMSAITLALVLLLFPPDRHNPRSLIIIYVVLLTVSTCGVRLLWRSLFEMRAEGRPVAIYGVGSAGKQLLSALEGSEQYRVVLLLDDNVGQTGETMSGIPLVDASSEQLPTILRRLEVSRVILAMPSLGAAEYQRKIDRFSNLDVPVQTVPSIAELFSGTAKVSQIRDISLCDILGRSEVLPDSGLMRKCVLGRRLLVTGGGGSIGSELCRQILVQQPGFLTILDSGEENLYNISEELREVTKSLGLNPAIVNPVLGSVTDKALLRRLFKTHRFDAVYHAAAYKHVPIVERFPEQAVRVNVLGTRAVAESAIHAGVKDFVLVSTDKAVRPRNAMGASKRVAELVIQALADNGGSTRLSMVRFGNVLGSSGSVVPKFQQQILKGGPITLTHREITRYFMTIPEAAQLVLQAGAVAKSGDVFVLDMGEPVRIEDLAKTMVHLYGKRLHEDTGSDEDIKIEVGGLRAGEKMFEELFLSTTERRPTGVRKVFTASEPFMGWSQLSGKLETLKSYADAGDDDHVRQLLLELAFYDTSVGDERPSKPSRAYVAETRRERTAATEVH